MRIVSGLILLMTIGATGLMVVGVLDSLARLVH